MILVSRTFHVWCGLIPSQETLSSSPVSPVDPQIYACNHAYLSIIKKYSLNLENKAQLREQMKEVIQKWIAYWFIADSRGHGGVGSVEEEIIIEVVGAIIFGVTDPKCAPSFSEGELDENHIVTALAIVSYVCFCIYLSDKE